MARIALDVMGGDHAPEAPVAAALLAVQELAPSHELQLVGREAVIREELSRQLVGASPMLREAVSAFAFGRRELASRDRRLVRLEQAPVAFRAADGPRPG